MSVNKLEEEKMTEKEKKEEKKTPFWKRTEIILGSVAGLIGAVAALINAIDRDVFFPPPQPPIPPVEGLWIDSTNNFANDRIHLFQEGTAVHGSYNDQENGKIVRRILQGQNLETFWVEDHSAQPCNSNRDGRSYWGHVKITFNEDGNKFNGWWGYCENNPNFHFTGEKLN